MNLLSLSFTVLLAAPSPATPANPEVALQRAVEGAEELEPDQAIAVLEAAIANARRQPDDLHAKSLPSFELLDAYTLLARLELATGDEDAASATLDALIVLDIARRAPVHGYGPALTELYEGRYIAAQRAGMASLELECGASSGCAFVLDGYRAELGKTGVHVGEHELWVSTAVGPDGEREWTRELFEVAPETDALVYRAPEGWTEDDATRSAPPPKIELAADASPPIDSSPPPTTHRLVPRRLAISGIVAGAGAVVAGALMLGLNDRCTTNLASVTDDTDRTDCPQTYKSNIPVAATLVAAGGALLLPSSIILGLDEVRVRRGQLSAVVKLGLRF